MATATIDHEIEAAKAAAQTAATDATTDRFLERLIERIGGQARIEAVFGEPIKRGETTVVPVARVRWAVGGGSGSAIGGPEETVTGGGSGGGGGMTAEPIGYLEIGPSGAMFEPIGPRFPSAGQILVSGIAIALVVRALARLIR